MNTMTTDELDDLRQTVRRFLADRFAEGVSRDTLQSVYEPTALLWKELVTGLGVQAVTIPEDLGGHGYDFAGQAVVLEELGRCVAPVPYLTSAVWATQLLLLAGSDEHRQEWLPLLADGTVTMTVAAEDLEAFRATGEVPLILDGAAGGGAATVSGVLRRVPEIDASRCVLLPCRDGDGVRLALLRLDDAGVRLAELTALDSTRRLHDLHLAGASVTLVDREDSAKGLRRAVDIATVAIACEQLGGTRRVLEMTVEHAGSRVQFDRPIGSFQSIKHLLAELLLDNEAAAVAVRHAVDLVAAGDDETLALAVSVAKSAVSDAYWAAARAAVQVHGAIGFTWEHDAHLFLKRAASSRVQLGSAELHRERLAAALLDA